MYDFTGYGADGSVYDPGYEGGGPDASSSFVWDPQASAERGMADAWDRMEQYAAEQARLAELEKWNPEFIEFLLEYLKTVEQGDEFRKVAEEAARENKVDVPAMERAVVEDARDGDHDAFFEKYGRRFDPDQFQFVWDYPAIFGLNDLGELNPPRKGFVEIGPSYVEDGLPPEWREETPEEAKEETPPPPPAPTGGGGGGGEGSGGFGGGGGSSWSSFETWGGGGGGRPSVLIGEITVVH